ncbi:glycoside hydrolase family 43 protein [Hymenobacter properus]|uniref:Glycoside hydrolase family 43 protein n=1 Tax=Hymenobacter properus TaxID=2791026 RepID=A0A931BHZ5_9BACT|nr:glycoside hydrolase family 43 protein [Hymenobacter properus]MBF9142622.1 glycoside hydrolase family 43 protein [Hymenobacter properus]MBR7721430.1 glycoside hydrolase family 43 protein [Microvirga sp. SRT04]
MRNPLNLKAPAAALAASLALLAACQSTETKQETTATTVPAETSKTDSAAGPKFLSQPLVKDIYTADPSAHVFDGKIYIYPSHDIETGMPENDKGDHFAMNDYHILSMDSVGGPVTDHGVALAVKDIPWAGRQLWAPDAAFKNGTYYLYFPVKDKQDVFRIGVATSKTPAGPFKAEATPIAGSFSIDPAVFTDTDGKSYMYFGGLWGGQLQRWQKGTYDANAPEKEPSGDVPALSARVGQLSADMKHFDGPVQDVKILDEAGKPLLASDTKRRFFEGSWMHKYNGKYYFSYSTGDTHLLVYAVGDKPTGPFTYKGVIMEPVQGWTTHHSIIEVKGKWYIFYHDTQLSGKTWLRNIKVTELKRKADGSIETIVP